MLRYTLNVLIATDRLFNALLGGSHNKTISQRMGLWRLMGGWRATAARPMCWVLDIIHPDHCIDCLENDDYAHQRTHHRNRPLARVAKE